ncbi:fungal-specific transcription factor domain-containing protein [Aspergillus coremiiformis]|uniref:Fungal-specific transcription factor domain-containing protein n=1 Tax=Aspergillus coremiiformis TaxID=138285 RepID=A0A5N6Z7U7_9EURO|nr:fungal-specific transcription factor domain-containing protein [Aspergillus coremiiformis]
MADYRRPKLSERNSSQPATSTPKVQLTCELCRQRKVKCDKLNPCTNCQRFGATCVPVERARLPRGRSGRLAAKGAPTQDTSLKERVSRLEERLLELTEHGGGAITAQATPSTQEGSNQASASKEADKPEPDTENSFLAETLREIRDIRSTGGPISTNEARASDSSSMKYKELLAMPGAPGLSMALGQPVFTVQGERGLARIFLEKIDPVFKIFHTPSLKTFLLDGKPYLDYEPGHMGPTALALAVYFAAACSATEDESQSLFGCEKSCLVARYQLESEAALAKADFMTSNDMTILQAFVLFLLASRSQDSSRRVWTMLSMALRIAQALSLHLPDLPFPVRPFERELRRRLWLSIGFLDIQCSLECASEPMMQVNWIQSNQPANVNDSDISFNMDHPVQDSAGFTDMTFTIINMKAQCITRLLNFTDFTDTTTKNANKRQQLAIDFQETASTLLKHCQPDKVPFHWFTRQVAETISAATQLIVLRPLHRNVDFIPPRIQGDHLLQMAVAILQKSKTLRTDPRGTPWRWLKFLFVPWHALAVAIAELCVCRELSVMERFWRIVREEYECLGDLIGDSHKGMIWKPMKKLMAQAEAKRTELFATSHITPRASSFPPTPPLQGPVCSRAGMQPSVAWTGNLMLGTGPHTESGPAVTLPETVGLRPWPSVWDAVDFGCPVASNEMSWLNYENFIEDIHGNMDDTLLSH